jgi:aerobic C4-dicarboxylate transport protein
VFGLVIPTGYSFNLDAFSIYLTLAVVFIAQATNTPLLLGDLLLVLAVSLVTSKGAHGIPGSAIVIPVGCPLCANNGHCRSFLN